MERDSRTMVLHFFTFTASVGVASAELNLRLRFGAN